MAKKLCRSILEPVDRLFDELYGSQFNPLYRSGTLAVTVLTIATITGGYLLFFYRLGAPYESIMNIDSHLLLSGWVRTLHRYTSDLAVVIVVFHIFRMIAEGKTWGPRLLAWLTGVGLTVVLFVIGWTGFVMVWDRQGQALAVAGAKIVGVIPLFTEVLTRSVSGATSVGSSFFFLNLFLHMSLPLGMIFGLWLHTSNLNKPAWFPEKKYLYFFVGALIALSFLWPAPFSASADLLDLNEKYQLNIFYSFVIPLVHSVSPAVALLIFFGFFGLLVLVPFILRPHESQKPKVSTHNPAACTGCSQCSQDCPFDAIDMVPRTVGTGSDTIAFVDVTSCVGCGICAASCTQVAIGPEDKSGRMQMQKIKEMKAQYSTSSSLYVYCNKNSLGESFLSRKNTDLLLAPYPIECTGNFHVASAAFALGHFENVYIVGCPSHACVNRLGQKLLEDRFLRGREPAPPGRMDLGRVHIFSGSRADLDQLQERFSNKSKGPQSLESRFLWLGRLKVAVATSAILAVVAFFSSVPYENLLTDSILRIAIRLPGQAHEVCRERKPEELASLPMHMRNLKECVRSAIDYRLTVQIDGRPVSEQIVKAPGARGDKPLVAQSDLPVSPGAHHVTVRFAPIQTEAQNELTQALVLEESFEESFEKGRAVLVSFNINTKTLFHSKNAVK